MIRGLSIAGVRPRRGSKRNTQISVDRYGGQSNARGNILHGDMLSWRLSLQAEKGCSAEWRISRPGA